MRSSLIPFVVAIGLLICSSSVRAQGKLSSVRETLSTPKPKKSSSSSSSSHDDDDHDDDDSSSALGIFFSSDGDCHDDYYHHHHDDCCDDDDDGLGGFFAKALLAGVTSPIWMPMAALEDGSRTETNFDSFPYNHTRDGYLMFDTLEHETHRDDSWAARLYSEYGTNFDGLDRYGGRLMLETSSRLGLDTEWNYWTEDLGSTTDHLWTGDINLIVRFAQSEHAQFRTGLGWNWLQDDVVGHQNGFNFTYGFDLFPAKPFVIETTLDLGRIDSSTLVHLRSTAGVVYEHVELFAGYDFRNLDSVNLSGIVTGVTLWW